MYSQSFSPLNLYSCTTQTERRNSGLGKEEFVRKVESCIGDSINNGTFQFQIRTLEDLYLNGHPKKSIEHICQDLVLRKLYNNIKRIYGVEQANRNLIVRQMVSLLKEESDKWIVRLDVHHFFESINRNRLMERFIEDGRLNYQSIKLLEGLFSHPAIASKTGLPRGLSISSVMSELYMKYFDLEIRRMDGVFFYARFVDDVIVFCSNETDQKTVWTNVSNMLSKIDLKLNLNKSYKWDNKQRNIDLTYLGYTFLLQGRKSVEVLISEKKVNVIKTRITKSFVCFSKDGDFNKLKNRIKFLTGNFTLYNPSTLLPIKVGIYFNYNMITDKAALYNLDKYYQRLLHCRTGRLGSQLAAKLSAAQKTDLIKYSFVFGFENHVNHFFTAATLADITGCWR
ncbi:MAG: RNA-directed DNA polymerase [Paludibacteraceae bacterium]|nr:RNA-directed DNA polymerase [Paludibacteraceae bacterium]